MRSSSDMYSLVADNCSQYKMKLLDSLMNVGDEHQSCTNCKHFSNDAYCKIDLYDPIAARFSSDHFE
ncbi:MAG: hypothetical protein K0R15_2748 [Clostridiales bacterium]|jgi:recombinational DNA repair protein RecR|nr:hypothetical protein [Clostridiales bacterium]